MSDIVMKTEHRQTIARHAEAVYPRESRGLLLGHRNGTFKQVVELAIGDGNSHSESQGSRYHIPSHESQKGAELAKANGLEIIGSFHSHVDQPARPSIQDRESAQPALSYVLVGVRDGRAHELTAWRLSEDGSAFFQEIIRSG